MAAVLEKLRFHTGKLQVHKLRVSASALVLPAIVYFLHAEYFILLTVMAVLAHELGHYLALRMCGGAVLRIDVWLGGVSIEYGGLGYGGEVIAALAGPGASVLLALGSSLCGRIFLWEAAYHLAGLSLVLGMFNMLPVFPLDGGRALFSAMARIFGLRAADWTRQGLTAVVTSATALAGAVLLWRVQNPTLLIAAIWLAFSAVRARKVA